MTELALFGLTLASAIGCALNGGVYFAFSIFVMKALAKLPPQQGIAAMESINACAITPLFMGALFGTALLCAILVATAFVSISRPGATYLLAGGILYLLGTIAVTMLFNVPRNNALAALDPSSASAPALWKQYVDGWTAWNHVRTVCAIVAAALLTLGMADFK